MQKRLSMKQNIMYNTIGSLFYLGCQWLTTILIVRLGNYQLAGELSLAISLSNTFTTVANFGMRNFQVSDIKDKYSAGEYVSMRLLTCCGATFICLVFAFTNAHYSGTQILTIVLYMIFRDTEAFIDVLQGIQQKADRMDYIGISLIVRGVLSLVGFFCGLVITKNLPLTILIMMIPCYVVLFLYDIKKCKSLVKLRIQVTKGVLQMLRECSSLMITLVLTTSIISISRYYLEFFHGKSILGYYASVATPAVIVQSLCIMIYTPLTTTIAKSYIDRNVKSYRSIVGKALLAMAIVSVGMIAGAALLGEWGLVLIFGESIREYAYLFVPVIVTTIMVAFVYFFSMILTVSRRLKTILCANAIAVIGVYAMSHTWIKQRSMTGVNESLYLAFGLDLLVMIVVWLIDCSQHFRDSETKGEEVE